MIFFFSQNLIESSTLGSLSKMGGGVRVSKATLDKSLGFAQFKRDVKDKVYTKRFYMHIIIIPEQIVENPNFKPILVEKE